MYTQIEEALRIVNDALDAAYAIETYDRQRVTDLMFVHNTLVDLMQGRKEPTGWRNAFKLESIPLNEVV